MGKFTEMPLNQQIELYYEKHHALRLGDMTTLIELRNKFPEIFDKSHDDQIRNLIEYFKKLKDSAQYKALLRSEAKRKLEIIEITD